MASAAAAAALLLLDSCESDDEVQPPPQRRRQVWVGEMCKHRDTEGVYYFIGLILIKKNYRKHDSDAVAREILL